VFLLENYKVEAGVIAGSQFDALLCMQHSIYVVAVVVVYTPADPPSFLEKSQKLCFYGN